MQLSPALENLVLHWGKMGTRWGINRSVAQIYALLFFHPDPLPADEITETLSLSRSNVSTSLRELQNWGIVTVTQKLGDSRDHFKALEDVWETFQNIAAERRRREFEPTLDNLHESLESLEGEGKGDNELYMEERLSDMLEFLEAVVSWHNQIRNLSPSSVQKLANLGTKIQKILEIANGK
ncbi:GbsR/MarR family transcriptional regulator [Fodinibius salsisoli]|uniref:HTH-type transcriptional regulator n=1 Tax=Fodinibius salsisoli TaxID=2820877 RepID=A0ABT3PQA7_9BACT|nr:MarR family transcriptional regulator [Fodinibius salsisoli]MCW9708043.1 MarR family transcriptional regulator [Fodinibius salsisoli]